MPSVIVCSSCDLAHRAGPSSGSQATRCARCRAPLQRAENGSIDTAIALTVTAALLFVFANAYPLVEIYVNGTTRSSTLLGAALGLYQQNHLWLAALVFVTTVAGPLLQIACLLYLLIPLRRKLQAPGQGTIFRMLNQLRRWTFIEVFMLGCLVALVRVAAYARVVPGVALWSCGLLMLTLAALTSRTTAGQFWRWVEGSRE